MTERISDRRAINNLSQHLRELTGIAFGLPFMANPDVLLELIEERFRDCVRGLLTNGSERNEMLQIIKKQIPDGKEHVVAGMINYALNRRPLKCKKRRLNILLDGKPHLTAVNMIRIAGGVFSRGDSLKDR